VSKHKWKKVSKVAIANNGILYTYSCSKCKSRLSSVNDYFGFGLADYGIDVDCDKLVIEKIHNT